MIAYARTTGSRLTQPLRIAVGSTVAINLIVGAVFLLGPELNVTLWPTPISPVLMRFIGAIILGNGVGAWMIVREATWESARVLFTVAIVYGVAVLVALLYQLLRGAAEPIFWLYVVLDALFLVPIGAIYVTYERARRNGGAA
jgi:hypothetical protein